MSRSEIVDKSTTKDSPSFKVGDKVKHRHDRKTVYEVQDIKGDRFYLKDYTTWFTMTSFNLAEPKLDKQEEKVDTIKTGFKYDPDKVRVFIGGEELVFPQRLEGEIVCKDVQLTINQQEEINMSNANNRRIVTVQVFDLDPALEVQHSLVHVFKDVVTEDTNEVTLAELLHTGDLVEPLKVHNELRVKQDNKEILNKTGKKVKLEPVKVKNLNFKYI